MKEGGGKTLTTHKHTPPSKHGYPTTDTEPSLAGRLIIPSKVPSIFCAVDLSCPKHTAKSETVHRWLYLCQPPPRGLCETATSI